MLWSHIHLKLWIQTCNNNYMNKMVKWKLSAAWFQTRCSSNVCTIAIWAAPLIVFLGNICQQLPMLWSHPSGAQPMGTNM